MKPASIKTLRSFVCSFSLVFSCSFVGLASAQEIKAAQPIAPQSQIALVPTSNYPVARPPADAIWPWQGSDLKPDPAMISRVLPNGVRYVIRPNKLPTEAVAIRMSIDAGSRDETDGQLGFAHLVEHMAFNGSENIPEGEMTKLMERLGASFGADVNAHTSYTETQYKLDLPRAGDGRLETGIKIMRETASKLLFNEDAIAREIGVVKSEASTRDTPGARIGKVTAEFLRPDDLATKRNPIGDMKIVAGANKAALRAFYDKWYRPERATLVVAGDVDVTETVALITRYFADWKPKSPEKPVEPDNGTWPKPELRAKVIVEPDIPTSLTVVATRPDEFDYGDLDTKERRAWSILQEIGADVFRRRLATLQLVDDPPASSVGFSQSASKNGFSSVFWLSPRGEDWQRGFSAVMTELRQALETGFNQAEIDEAIKETRVGYERAVASAPTRRTSGFAASAIGSLVGKSVAITPEDSKALFEDTVAKITPDQVNQAFAWWWKGLDPAIIMVRKSPVPGLEDQLKAAWKTAMSAAVPKRTPYVRATFVPPVVGPPGKLVRRTERKSPEATIATFENGVTFAFKKTPYSQDSVSLSVRFGAGYLAFPIDDVYWSTFASSAWSGDGVGKLTRDQMITALAGRSTSMASTGVGDDTTGLGASPAKADLQEQLQVMLAQVVEPRLGPRAPSLLRDAITKGWDAAALTASGWLSFNAGSLYMQGSKQFEQPTLDDVLKSDDALARDRLKIILAKAPINVTVVGNLEFETALDAVAKTFGALPKREGLDPGLSQTKAWSPKTPGLPPVELRHKGPKTQGIVDYTWIFPSDRRLKTSRALSVLAEVVQLRLTEKVREAEGESYSPSAGYSARTEVPFRWFSINSSVRPEAVPKIASIIEEIVQDLARTGPTADELKRAVDPILEGIARRRQTNAYWSGLLADYGLPNRPGEVRGDPLTNQLSFEADYKAIKLQDLRRLAKRLLAPSKAIRVHVVPEAIEAPKPAVTETGKPDTPIG